MDGAALTVQGDGEPEWFRAVIQMLPVLQVVGRADKMALCSPSEEHLPLNASPALLWADEELDPETPSLFPLCVISHPLP